MMLPERGRNARIKSKAKKFFPCARLHPKSWISPPKTPVKPKTPSLNAENVLCIDRWVLVKMPRTLVHITRRYVCEFVIRGYSYVAERNVKKVGSWKKPGRGVKAPHIDFAGRFLRPLTTEEPDRPRPGFLFFLLCLVYHLLHVSEPIPQRWRECPEISRRW